MQGHTLPDFGRLGSPYSDERPPVGVLSSPYYWWFSFLRLNEEYRAVVKRKGRRAGELKELYADFGDVFDLDFKTWWFDHASLFGAFSDEWELRIAFYQDELVPFSEYSHAVNVTVPLDWDMKTLLRRFEEIIQGRLLHRQPRYELNLRGRPDAMAKAFRVYTLRAQHQRADEASWAEIAIAAALPSAAGLRPGDVSRETADQRREATKDAIKYFKRAEEYKTAAASRRFP